MPKEAEPKNRVLRMFPNYEGQFFRVSFTDEDFKPISYSDANYQNLIDHRVTPVLSNGIQVLGTNLSFLAYSSSSLRQHSCWFVAPFTYNGQKCDGYSIRASLGNFDHIKIASKYAARVGQAFSSTTPTITLQKDEWIVAEDIVINTMIFSDGIGRIAPECAKDIVKKLGKENVSGFQVNM